MNGHRDLVERSDEELLLLGLTWPEAAAITNENATNVAAYVIASRFETARLIRETE